MILELDGVVLRKIDVEKDDLTAYLSWLRDIKNNPFVGSVRKDFEMPELLTFVNQKNKSPQALLFGIFHGEAQELVGTVKLEPIDEVNKTTWLGIMIGDPKFRGIGVGYKSLKLVTRYAFEYLGLRIIYLGVDPLNKPAITLYERIGFIQSDKDKNVMYYSL
jgi:ribosomal-protein-alanine N-acetyltransferase